MVSFRTLLFRPAFVPPLVVGVLLCPLFAGIEPIGGDPDLMYRPIKRELVRSLREGTLPFWSDRFGLGVPLAAESHVAAFYPPNWVLYGLLDVPAAYRLSLWLHYVALAATTYACARVLGQSRPASSLVAIGFSLCGFQAIHAAHEPFYTLMPYLPLCLLLAERFLDSGRLVWAGCLALAWGVQLTAGHFQIQMWTAGLVLAVGAWRVVRGSAPGRRWLVLPASLLLGAGVAGVQLKLTWELTRTSNFSRPAHLLATYPFPLSHWAQWALPSLYLGGWPADDDPYWPTLGTTSEEASAYVGVIGLMLACVGLFKVPRSSSLAAWCWISALAFVLATMPTWWPPGYHLLMAIPVLGWFRAPARYTLLTSLGLLLLAGRGLDQAADARALRRGLFLATLIGVAGVAWWLAGAEDPLYRRGLGPATFPFRIAWAVLGWCLGLLVLLAWRRGRPWRWSPVVLLTAELAGMFYLGPAPWGPPIDAVSGSPVLRRLVEEPGVGLVAGPTQNLPVLAGLAPAYPILGITPPPPNYLLESSLLPPGKLDAEQRRWQRRFGVTHGIWSSIDDVSGTEVVAEFDDPVLRRVLRRDQRLQRQARWRVVRYRDPLPPAWIALRGHEIWAPETVYTTLTMEDLHEDAYFLHHDGAPPTEASARLTHADFEDEKHLPRHVDIDLGPTATRAEVRSWDGREAVVEHDGVCYLILRRTYYPGWTYRIDGGPEQPVLKVNGGLQCVPLVGRGPSRVTVRYRPVGLRRAVLVSALSASTALLIALGSLVVARRRPRP